MTIEELMQKRDQIRSCALMNQSFAMVYFGDAKGSEADQTAKKKMQLLDAAIDDYLSDDCGCGKIVRLNVIKGLLSEVEGALKKLDQQ